MRIVIKFGGSLLSDLSLQMDLIKQTARLRSEGHEIIIVHGGGKQLGSMLERLGIVSRFHEGLRITDEETRDVAQMLLAGKINKDIVAALSSVGCRAVGICGGDSFSFQAKRFVADDGKDLGFVGQVIKTQDELINVLLAAKMIPVIACLAIGEADYQYYNVNADQMAAAVAVACRPQQLIFATDVGGVRGEDGQMLAQLDRNLIDSLLRSGAITGGMRPKLRACLEALEAGVPRISIISGAAPDALARSVRGETVGTTIKTLECGDWSPL